MRGVAWSSLEAGDRSNDQDWHPDPMVWGVGGRTREIILAGSEFSRLVQTGPCSSPRLAELKDEATMDHGGLKAEYMLHPTPVTSTFKRNETYCNDQ